MANKSKRLSKNHKKQDLILAAILGIVVTTVGIFVVRFSGASNASFRRDPVTQMAGGKLVYKSTGTKVRVAASPAPGVNPVYTTVSSKEMQDTAKVCIKYTVLQRGTWLNMTYNNAAKQGISTSVGQTKNPGTYTHCLDRGAQAVDGTININVTPGSIEINKLYGVLRQADD